MNPFIGTVRGYAELGGLGAVVLEVCEHETLPGFHSGVMETGASQRVSDGLVIQRTVLVFGDHTPCHGTAESLLDRECEVRPDGEHGDWVFYPLDEDEDCADDYEGNRVHGNR